jgi:hypothetical protein
MILIKYMQDFTKAILEQNFMPELLSVLLTSCPTDLNVNNAVSGIDKMVFLVDPSIVNYIVQIYVYMS